MILFHILDHDELTFPFERLTRFVGLEGVPEVIAQPEALRTAYLAFRARFDKHVRIARWTFPLWMYVSVTGVIVYLMLYRM